MDTTRLRRLKEKETRRLMAVILGSKMLGIGGVLAAIKGFTYFLGTPAGASALQEPLHTADELVSPINTMWVLVAAFLVFFMQAGFMALEVGFARSRETVNIMMECIVDTCLCGILFWAVGFAWMFGAGNGLIGNQCYFLADAPAAYGTTGVAFLAFFLFQFAFADTTSTITSGAVVRLVRLQPRLDARRGWHHWHDWHRRPQHDARWRNGFALGTVLPVFPHGQVGFGRLHERVAGGSGGGYGGLRLRQSSIGNHHRHGRRHHRPAVHRLPGDIEDR